ncbi:uridine kinase family protein [Nakamurella deserti]|uniref:uridine kinase family protein n=1 Tax=Nakamurella deserti TaxID=2164074 RepID=UPI001F0BE706|nr:uridine kinase [Nakamurella deserti]
MTRPDPLVALTLTIRSAAPRLGAVRLVAVDGPSGSGKTTVADRLLPALAAAGERVALVRTDHFATWDEPFDWWPRLEHEVLAPVAAGRPAAFLAMDWSGGTPVPRRPVTVPEVDVLVLEGVSAARRAVSQRLSCTVWVEHPDRAVRTARAVARDGDAIREPLRRWQAAEDAWFAADGTRDRADVRWDVAD